MDIHDLRNGPVEKEVAGECVCVCVWRGEGYSLYTAFVIQIIKYNQQALQSYPLNCSENVLSSA